METPGDVFIIGLLYQQTCAIIDVKLSNADTDFYTFETMSILITLWGEINKDNHSKHCHEQQKHFTPFVLSVDGMLGIETLVILEHFS